MRPQIDPLNYAKVIKRYIGDRSTLDTFLENREKYALAILEARSEKDMKLSGEELQQYFSLLSKWNSFSPEYGSLKSRLDEVRLFQKAFKEKAELLGLGKFLRKINLNKLPHLAALSEQYKAECQTNAGAQQENDVSKEAQAVPSPGPDETLEQKTSDSIVIVPDSIDAVVEPKPVVLTQKPIDITLATVLSYYQQQGLVGEERTALVQTLGAINQLCFGIESLSGSGKSYTVDILVRKLLNKSDVYSMELSSKTAEMYDADTINKAKIIYIPELQKAMNSSNPLIIEVLKNITEGKDASRKVRDQSTQTNKKFTIKGNKGVIFTLASENAFKYDAEFARRVFILYTDISEQQTDNIIKYKAASKRHATGVGRHEMPDASIRAVKEHISECLYFPEVEFENPFADYIAGFIPRTIRARSYDDYFFDLIEASTKFNHKNRVRNDGVLFVNIEDVYTIDNLYWKQFVKTLLKIPLLGETALNVFNGNDDDSFRDQRKYLSAQDVYMDIRNENTSINYHVVEETLERLVGAGFLEKDDHKARKPRYFRVNEMPDFEQPMQWQKCFETGLAFMQENYPALAESWLMSQMDGNDVAARSPVDDSRVVLVKDYQ